MRVPASVAALRSVPLSVRVVPASAEMRGPAASSPMPSVPLSVLLPLRFRMAPVPLRLVPPLMPLPLKVMAFATLMPPLNSSAAPVATSFTVISELLPRALPLVMRSTPPLIVVEEIENGLDPRSIHLIVEEIRSAVLAGVTQVIITTHSPYLLDLLTLEHLVVVERDAEGHPRFSRPADHANLRKWAQEFAPGKLYTMGTLTGLSA